MPASTTRRLAGLRFEARPPELPEKLPRMDIAVFVGFAATGPLDRPVAIEDAAHFAQIFGDDLPLAWDATGGAPAQAFLAPAVRTFFANGGRRCWIIRVAGEAGTSFFPLPGLARIGESGLQPAFARARAPGSGADGWRVATALAARSLAVTGWSRTKKTLHAELGPRDNLEPGDLIRITHAQKAWEIFFVVEGITSGLNAAEDPGDRRVKIRVEPLGVLESLAAADLPSGEFAAKWQARPDAPRELRASAASAGEAVALDVAGDALPPVGALLRLAPEDDDERWFQVVEAQRAVAVGASARLLGRAFRWRKKLPPLPTVPPPLAAKLTFELRARRGAGEAARLIDLAFLAPHPRCWNALPDDERLFASADFREALDAAEARAHEALWRDTLEPRFPLAGDHAAGESFIPIGMSALAEPEATPQHSGRTALERDGLAQFSSALFLDSRLLDSRTAVLSADADFIRYETPGAPPLRGLHAALEIEEATLIAVPDAIHRAWRSVPLAEPPPPEPSPPREHPKRERTPFRECALRDLVAPTLLVDVPEAGGVAVLHWTSLDAGVAFIVEEATQPGFADAVEFYRGFETSRTLFDRPPGHYYYRTRTEAEGESSDWSDGVVISIQPPAAWQLEPPAAFDGAALLDVQRALLRCCAARGDLVALLSLPEHFRDDEVLAHLASLEATRVPAPVPRVAPLGFGEAAAFSYGAVYHPWLVVRESLGGLRAVPPDGAAVGLLARRALARGAWIAPANETFTGILALTPRLDESRQLDLLLAQLNVIRQEPRGFLALNADTLSGDADLRPLNVRRLLILLRRAALRLGMSYVFEPHDTALRRVVQGAFSSLLQELFVRGAFAGATPDAAYRVVVGDEINRTAEVEQGRFHVDLKVAPAVPLSFITVRLVQLGDHAATSEILSHG